MRKIMLILSLLMFVVSCKTAAPKVVTIEKVVYVDKPVEAPMPVAPSVWERSYGISYTSQIPSTTYEVYGEIQENKFINAKISPLSTFSIDVDTASYSNVRNLLNYNMIPQADAIKSEEMINYFRYNYPIPTKKDVFSVTTEVGNSPFNKNNKILKIGIQGYEIPKEMAPKTNLVFLIDVSGSMSSEEKLPLLKESFKFMLDSLKKDDRVSMVVYASATGVVLDSVAGNDRKTIEKALDKLSSGGSTAGGAGINQAYNLAQKNFIKDGNNRVILATDGDFNVGTTSNDELEKMIVDKKSSGIFLTVLGFGRDNLNDQRMSRLSNIGDGNYYYIDSIKEGKKVLSADLFGTIFAIAKDTKIQVEFNPTIVESYRLIGYEDRKMNNEDFKNDKKDAGDVGSGQQVTAYYEIVPKINASQPDTTIDPLKYQKNVPTVGNENEIATFKMRYKIDGNEVANQLDKIISVGQPQINTKDFNFGLAVAAFAQKLRNSEYSKDLTYEEILKLADENISDDKDGYKAEFIEMIKKVISLSTQKPLSELKD
ncbi:MAG: von Willebrand factor type A domain-containing protein [Leptotrichiaceae bacterium]|jgi:Ca-activated chloride channel family protein|nr:von Willebrand factor type A domain-containing protein [Leptotrichiaceae bacterium]MBP6168046.1 von Willebrand factor type A domain-containing protein [Leptotrichiaceae bacterium]MBP7025966.1 von Willebrand factor type A domain-containing protein [Leptotrichiaceae bacterium]MBP8637099.1 von Willebrand factor type A domain-containing protein [Leptotrichiaceae bacterium]MBP9539247.1 von Willebrand factor type A domain-containing protein [Leptotrichiaceae bacterium]